MAMKTYLVYNHEKNKEFVYGEFRKQLYRNSVEKYEQLVDQITEIKKLNSIKQVGEYNKIIQEQINESIIEMVNRNT